MTVFQALILGLIQGITEFLPVSSSGHLVLGEAVFGLTEPNLTFAVAVHFGTLLAILYFFRDEFLNFDKKLIKPLLVGSIPAGLIGILFKDQIEALFGSVILVGLTLMMTGLINLWTDKKLNKDADKKDTTSLEKLSWQQSIKIGLAQAMAIVPGISRSGSTIAAGIGQNLSREKAFFFSFLLAVISVGGATALQMLDVIQEGMGSLIDLPMVVGILAATVSGYFSLWLLKRLLVTAKLEIFGYYCLGLGVVTVIVSVL